MRKRRIQGGRQMPLSLTLNGICPRDIRLSLLRLQPYQPGEHPACVRDSLCSHFWVNRPPPPAPSSPSWAPRQKLFGGLGPMYRQEALYRHLGNKAIIFSGYSNEILIRNPLKKTELILELMRSGVLKFPPLEVLKNWWLGYFPNLQWEWDVILLFRGLKAPRVETWVCKWI